MALSNSRRESRRNAEGSTETQYFTRAAYIDPGSGKLEPIYQNSWYTNSNDRRDDSDPHLIPNRPLHTGIAIPVQRQLTSHPIAPVQPIDNYQVRHVESAPHQQRRYRGAHHNQVHYDTYRGRDWLDEADREEDDDKGPPPEPLRPATPASDDHPMHPPHGIPHAHWEPTGKWGAGYPQQQQQPALVEPPNYRQVGGGGSSYSGRPRQLESHQPRQQQQQQQNRPREYIIYPTIERGYNEQVPGRSNPRGHQQGGSQYRGEQGRYYGY